MMGLFVFMPMTTLAQTEEAPPAPEATVREKSNKKAAPAPAPAAKPAASAPAEEEIDVSDLADEYWRPQKDDLEVVQNKRFTKTGHVEATALYSFLQTHQYSDSLGFGLALTYNFTERWGFEASYLKISNTSSDFLRSVEKQYGFTPNFNLEKSQTLGMVTWAPVYGKFALLGRKISHYDFYTSLGGGTTQTAAQHFTWAWALGSRFFVWKNLVVRAEFRIANYTDKITATRGSQSIANGGPGFYEDKITRRNLVLGVGWLF